MSMQTSHTGFQIASVTMRRSLAGVLALTSFVAAGCASGGAAAGTYHPNRVSAANGAAWAGEPSGVHINVSLDDRKLYLKDGSTVLNSYTVGVGRDGNETPQGDYTVRRIVWNPPWSPPDAAWADGKESEPPGSPMNPMKVVKIYFKEPDYYIHGTGSVSTLGGAVSHGCLRMAPEDAASLAKALMSAGGAGRDEAWFASVRRSNETETVVLPDGIPMHVAD